MKQKTGWYGILPRTHCSLSEPGVGCQGAQHQRLNKIGPDPGVDGQMRQRQVYHQVNA
ncbi:hypothetical protein [Dehalogenimonas etheniformans]|uniref:hypothetical protein n=1 Tax=Dehalogenimonas etheniformans TaxID=1536648 RepID=UPI0013922411|nr:hypothetical protein [Dehalogenimonas etheniformans]